ncbi:uncharacterized protein SP2353 [Calliphora vicina]|uniref:uncharacterized protein SP2353 n=1 Tax=Calliphora vicina TaxID=7373 RepID=UPI00325C114E
MRKTKDNMLMHGFILVTILATAKSAEAEITMEAAFQGHCGHTSPCEQLCYEIHDGMYECDCIEGYELNKNGYSCQVINSSGSGDGHSKSDEDVLYQKGASFSAKLANNDNNDDNHLTAGYSSSSALGSSSSLTGESGEEDEMDDSNYLSDDLDALNQRQNQNSNDYYISNESSGGIDAGYEHNNPVLIEQPRRVVTMSTTKPLNLLLYRYRQRDQNSMAASSTATTTSSPFAAAAATATTSSTTMDGFLNGNIDDLDDYYSKQDMSVYDDVNNNQLNLRPISHPTYQQQKQQATFKNSDQQQPLVAQTNSIVATDQLQQQYHTNIILQTATSAQLPLQQSNMNATTSGMNKISTNISYNISSSETNEICNLECGTDGICDNTEGSSRCLCPFGKTNNNCAEDLKVRVPKFSKHSWLAFPALRGAYKHVQLRIEFRPESFNGIILLSGERDDLTGDFMALLLNKGFVEFWFDCGSGAGSVRSRETILLNEWNSVIIYRHRWDAWLVLNHGTKVQGRSNGLFSRITFREPVFLGGTGNITGLANRLPITDGFLGCIRRFMANEHDYKFEEHPLGDVVKGFDIQDCVTDKCFKYPCQHGGKCLPSDQGAVCLCPIGFVGDLCEIRMDLQVPAFNGSSFLRYAPLADSALIWLELKVILKPELSDGLILYSGPKHQGDFVALALSNGFVEFTFDLGSGPAVVRSQYPLSIGQWHTIKVSRTARLAVLKIDQMPEVMTISSNGFWHLSLPENLFVGGVNHVDKLPMDLKNKPFFMGCIQRIEINGHSLAIVSEALGGTNIGNCPHACVARPCGPLAECVPQMESYECRCSAYNAQCNKEAEVSIEELQKNKALAKSKQHGTHNDLEGRESYKQQLQHQQHRKGINHKKFKKQQQMMWHKQQQQQQQHGKTTQKTKLTTTEAAATTTTTTSTTTTTTTTTPTPTTTTTAALNWQGFNNVEVDNNFMFDEVPEALQHILDKVNNDNQANDDDLDLDDDEEEDVMEDDDLDEIEDDIIFRDIKAMHEQQLEQQQQLQQQMLHAATKEILNKSKSNVKLQRNRNKRKHTTTRSTSTTTTTTTTTAAPPSTTKVYARKYLHTQQQFDSKPDPHHKTPIVDKPQHKLSRLPTHYESFQTNTGSDILTFDDPAALEKQWRDYEQASREVMQEQEMNMEASEENDEVDDNTDEGDDEWEETTPTAEQETQKEETFVIDESLFDDSDGTEDYQRKQLAQDMKRIMANTKGPYVPKQPKLIITEYDYSNEHFDNQEEQNIDDSERKKSSQVDSTQTHTDWSLLSKFDLPSNQNHPIGVRKNFGACFAGQDSYFHYNDAETMSQIISYTIDLNLRIKTRSENGVILWTGRVGTTDQDNDDYLSLGIEEGYLHFRYNLGSGEVDIRFNTTKVSDGLWHRVRAIRDSQEGYLEVDGRKSPTLRSPGKLRQLNTDTGLYVGGMPDASYFTRRRYSCGIIGCISEIVLAGELKMNFDPNTLGTAHNVETGIL